MPTDATLRQALPEDLPVIAEILCDVRAQAPMPPMRHSPTAVREWVVGWDLTASAVWVAEREGQVVGYVRWTPTWLEDLYVLPAHHGRGMGAALLGVVKGACPNGFGLWVFESNEPARDFYAAHGLLALERTDGSANEELAPDIKMVWPGRDPLGFLRSMIDEVDLLLGDVLARRAALTRVVQSIKPTGHRDSAREAEIAARVAALVPELGAERVARIVDVIIAESLDAASTNAGPPL